MSFQTRPIRKRPPVHVLRKLKHVLLWLREKVPSHANRHYAWGAVLAVIGVVIVFKVMTGIYGWMKTADISDLFFSAGSDLKQDPNGLINIALLGDGGALRDGADLVDTIMVASLNPEDKSITLFSVPRDFYVDSTYKTRINALYRDHKTALGSDKAYELFPEVLGKITGLQIPYYLRVDFTAFVEVVDSLGGIDVEVPKAIDDPFYPNASDDGYEPFSLAAGLQHMEGETALKFARSRKTTSDYDRAIRQHLVLGALREKALSLDALNSPKTLKSLYGSLTNHLNTNLSLREMLSLAHFAKTFDHKRLISKVIHDDPGQEGGFLYTPERELYGGQFVLVPDGDNFDLIHRYADLIFHERQAFYDPLKIEILNGTKTSGIAGKIAFELNRFGLKVVAVDNLVDAAGKRSYSDKTILRYYGWTSDKNGTVTASNPSFLAALKTFLNVEPVAGDPSLKKEADITLILGSDYQALVN